MFLDNTRHSVQEREQAVLCVQQHLALPLVLRLLGTLRETEYLELEVLVRGVPAAQAVHDRLDRTCSELWSDEILSRAPHMRLYSAPGQAPHCGAALLAGL